MRRSPRTRAVAAGLLLSATMTMAAGCSGSDPQPDRAGGPAPAPSPADDRTTPPEDPSESPFTEVDVVDTIATDLRSPWAVAFLPDGSALVTQRDSGTVLHVTGHEVSQVDAGGPDGALPQVHHETEDGLLGIAVGPDGGIYLYLTTAADNRVIRMDLEGERLVDPRVVLDGIPSGSHHDGGRLAFGPDGYLYITTGDTREPSLSQDIDSLAGKILRVSTTGEPAPGNPFGNEVWSYGHRNVQGIGWTDDGRMYASEFGENSFDELNLIEPGGNYGWPAVEGWAGDPQYVDPLVTWPTSEASPSGIAVTDDGVWVAALRGERLWFVPLEPGGAVGEPRDYLDLGRLRDVLATPDGGLWVVTSNTDGRGDPRGSDDRIVRVETS
ncbi:sorbosone dehydrogenase family protein [Pseudactinotalea sp. HY158]|uniref:PQQ-dependent sugar dehydrogenase n=1 Tax=Pseudactinotalea sp. HY158 TaxID=2654547 RepID=UPI00129C54A5|nr:PQQ-dependent sugar dehydrogenase [Pseudactinotalea sp. HY158]QGH68486.1 PQQ-dependent sugar dehydrogenase [Pseudactinotalea sp. HY158]